MVESIPENNSSLQKGYISRDNTKVGCAIILDFSIAGLKPEIERNSLWKTGTSHLEMPMNRNVLLLTTKFSFHLLNLI